MYHRNCDYFVDRKWPDHGLIIYCYWVIVSTDYMSSFCVLAPKAVCQYDTRIVMSAPNRFLALTKQAEHCITLWTGCALWCVWLRSESSTALLMYRVCFEMRVVAVGAEHCITYVQGVLCDAWDCFTCVIHYTCKFLFFVFLIWSFEMTFHIWYTSVVNYSYLQDKIYSAGIFCHFPNGNVHVYANKAFFVKLQFYC